MKRLSLQDIPVCVCVCPKVLTVLMEMVNVRGKGHPRGQRFRLTVFSLAENVPPLHRHLSYEEKINKSTNARVSGFLFIEKNIFGGKRPADRQINVRVLTITQRKWR